jgi:DNA-binding response regulator
MNVLIIEDEIRLAEAIGELLKKEKHHVDIVNDGQEGYEFATGFSYDAIILDAMLPKMDGFEVLKKIRAEKLQTPILMLTALSQTDDVIKGLDFGADDYMTKPFETKELLARLRSITRRKGEVILNELNFGDLVLDLDSNQIKSGVKSIQLGYKEFEIMRMLMTHPQMISTKEDIIVKVWGIDSDAADNNVEVYISFLRKKLQFLKSSVAIQTIRKVGYKLDFEK